jgi:hypothetical protein
MLFLAAQVVVIGLSLTYETSSSFEIWLWHLDREWNVPATLASLQLALIGFVALLIAWRAVTQKTWQRLYFAALGTLFLFLAYDEYAVLHEFVHDWKKYYYLAGGIVVALTLVVASLSERSAWKWHGLLLVGLAMSALGGLVVEANCGHPFFVAIDLCEMHFKVEEPLEFVGMWLALLALLRQLDFLPASARIWRALYVFPLLWLLLLVLSPAVYSVERYRSDSSLADVQFETGLRLLGYRIGRSKDSAHLFLSPGPWDFKGRNFAGLGYSIDLIDQATGESVLSHDKVAHHHFFMLGPGYMPIYRQWVDIDRPETLPTNRAYSIVLALWREDGDAYPRQRILASDHPLLGDTQVALGELVIQAENTAASPLLNPLAAFNNGVLLADAEWPERAGAGAIMPIDFTWRSVVDGEEDHAQFLHLRHAESGEWWVYDQLPLGPRLPTRLWYAGLSDSETWQAPLPADLAPGRYSISTGLYRSRDRERVPAKNADGSTFHDGRVPLGSLVVE